MKDSAENVGAESTEKGGTENLAIRRNGGNEAGEEIDLAHQVLPPGKVESSSEQCAATSKQEETEQRDKNKE